MTQFLCFSSALAQAPYPIVNILPEAAAETSAGPAASPEKRRVEQRKAEEANLRAALRGWRQVYTHA